MRLTAALRRNGLAVATGLAAGLPVIVSTVRGVADGWLPLADDGIIAVRSFDVLSTHPPLLGQYSSASQVIGKPVLSPGPMLYWLLALPVRIGESAPAITMGIVNTGSIIGIALLARRRGGLPLMFAAAAGAALMCGSVDAAILHDVWNPAAALQPFATRPGRSASWRALPSRPSSPTYCRWSGWPWSRSRSPRPRARRFRAARSWRRWRCSRSAGPYRSRRRWCIGRGISSGSPRRPQPGRPGSARRQGGGASFMPWVSRPGGCAARGPRSSAWPTSATGRARSEPSRRRSCSQASRPWRSRPFGAAGATSRRWR